MAKNDNSSRENAIKDLISVPSIGKLTARILVESDYDSLSKLKEAELADLKNIIHIGEKKAEDIFHELKEESYEKEEREEEILDEFRCPECDSLIGVEEESCPECDEDIEIRGGVIVPEHGMIEEPKKKLAEVEERLWDGDEDAETWFIRGAILDSMGADQEALESYNRVIELDPFFDHIWNSKAKASLKVGKNREAAKAYKLAFDIQGLPENIKYQIEKESTTSAQEIKELREKDEKEKKAFEKISEARENLNGLVKKDIDISEITSLLDEAIEKRLEDEPEKALKKAEKVIEKEKMISSVNKNISEVKDRLEDVEYEKVKEKIKKDIDQINELIDKGNYSTAEKLAKNLSYGMEFERKKQEKREFLLEELQNKIEKVEKLMDELSAGMKDLIDIDEEISKAEKALEEDDFEEAFELVTTILDNENKLKNISELMDKIETMSMGLEGIDAHDDFLGELDEKYEEGKELCKSGKYAESQELLQDLLNEVEEKIDQTVKTTEEEISELMEQIDDHLTEAEEKGLDIEDFEQEYQDVKEKFETDQMEEKEMLDTLQNLKKKGDHLLDFRPNITKIEEMIEEYGEYIDKKEYREDLQDISDSFEKGNFEEAVSRSKSLRKELEKEVESVKEESMLEEEAEEKISRARKKLADIRRTEFDIGEVKGMLKKSAEAKKEEDLKESIEYSEKMIETVDDMLEISDLKEEIRDKIDTLEGKDLIDKERYLKELERYLEASDIGEYNLTYKYLNEMADDLQKALEEEKSLPPSEEEEIINSSEYIKDKVKNVKEFKALIEESGVEVQFDKEYLKKAIVKIKDMEYEEAGNILDEGKNALIERLNERLEERLDSLAYEIEKFDNESSQNRAKALMAECKDRWERGDTKKALDHLVELSNFVERLSEKDDLLQRRRYSIHRTIEDIEGFIETEEFERLLEKSSQEDTDKKKIREIIVDIKDLLESKMREAIDDEFEHIEKILDEGPEGEKAILIGDLSRAKKSLRAGELTRAAWYLGEYNRVLSGDESKSETE